MSSSLPRVLMLPKWYPNRYDDLDGDFVERHIAAIAPHARAAVLYATVAQGPQPRLVEYVADWAAAVPTLRYYYRARPTGLPPLDKLLKLLLYFGCLLHGYGRLRRRWGRPQLVHVHVLLRTGLAAWGLKLLTGIPFVITEHWTLYLPPNAHRIGRLRRWLTARVVRAAAALHTVSADLRAALARLGAVNPQSFVIPNVVDTELFRPDPAPIVPSIDEQQRGGRLLHVAAFNEQAKNLSGLLRVVARLRPRRPQLTLRVVGYGPYDAQLRALARELGLMESGAVTFLGKLDHVAVAAEMRRAGVFVLFSNYENLPCVLIEAQASGLPAVATRVGGVPELLPGHDARGRLVMPRDEAALEQALDELLSQPLPQPEALRTPAVARFSYPAVGRQFAELYARVLGAASATAAAR
ncbi:glycosyltransferase [Hymenobacter sp. B81]|uniref:glycosyltransferase n=1 Tax=Hymenobacter sp. B81 TaxID=3344878 RepID=UPI0037DD12CF